MSVNQPNTPFWQPWGAGGCLWRTLLFLLGLLIICSLLGLMRGCDRDSDPNPFGPDPVVTDSIDDRKPWGDPEKNPYMRLPQELRDTSIVRQWNDSIPGVEELPDPGRNFIPPIDSSRIVTDPTDSLSRIISDQLIVFFNSQDLKTDMTNFARRFKTLYPGAAYSVAYYQPAIGSMILNVPADEREAIRVALPDQIPDIDFIVANNEILREGARPTDPGFSVPAYDDYFNLIQAYEAWDVTKGSDDVVVAIVDSYFDLSNPEIGERVVNPISIPTKTSYVLPPYRLPLNADELVAFSHGSHVAGLAIGGHGNGLGAGGIAPLCKWMPISLGNQMTTFNIIEGILYAVNNGADVVNVSIGRVFPDDIDQLPLADQVRIATSTDRRGEALWDLVAQIADRHNCTIVKSAGNDNILMGMDPKNRTNGMIKVEAVDNQGMAADFSNFGKVPEANLDYSTVAAPGVNMWSASPRHCLPFWQKMKYTVDKTQGFQEMSGTSMSAPVVAGAVALLKSKNPDLTNAEVENILVSTARQTDTRHRIGPTIQLRDALDVTGGKTLNFDDLMNDHNLLLGRWKSTYTLHLVNSDTGEELDDMWCFFTFTTTDSGVLEYQTVKTKRIYRCNVSVKWGKSSLTIIQHGPAISSDGNTVNADEFVCTPDAQRLLEVSCRRNGQERFKFKLQKVS